MKAISLTNSISIGTISTHSRKSLLMHPRENRKWPIILDVASLPGKHIVRGARLGLCEAFYSNSRLKVAEGYFLFSKREEKRGQAHNCQ